MSRDGWAKKRANAGGDNGWAERVSIITVSIIMTNNAGYEFTTLFLSFLVFTL